MSDENKSNVTGITIKGLRLERSATAPQSFDNAARALLDENIELAEKLAAAEADIARWHEDWPRLEAALSDAEHARDAAVQALERVREIADVCEHDIFEAVRAVGRTLVAALSSPSTEEGAR